MISKRRKKQAQVSSTNPLLAVHPTRDFLTKNKAEVITLSVLVLCAVLALGGYLIYTSISRAQFNSAYDAFKQSHSYQVAQGQTLVLDSEKEEQGNPNLKNMGNVPAEAFDWSGTMDATLLDSYIYDSPTAAGMGQDTTLEGLTVDQALKEEPFDKEGARFLVCDRKLKNINATGQMTAKDLPFLGDDAAYAFNSSIFSLESDDPAAQGESNHRYVDIADGLISNPPTSWRGLYTLRPGEEKTLKLGFFIPANLASNKYVLTISVDGSFVQYRIACSPSIEDASK